MPIGIIGAMEEEVALIRQKLTDTATTHIAGSEFTEGKLEGVSVVLVKSGIGKVNAAMTTTILCQLYQPTHMINTGSAGGVSKDLQVGDLVISTEVLHHDVDVTAFGYVPGQVPGMPATFSADESLRTLTKQKASALMGLQAAYGWIASGDAFMQDSDRVKQVKSQFPHVIATEMEAAAIAQVAYAFKVPFVVIRALSDIAGQESNVSFESFLEQAAEHSTTLVEKVIVALGV
ncbi:5'-methylthioadenosine/S-adenosylhomocysteine nucleosidase [Bacillus fonticola]|uniref:5'-methylthioadenosine/S-adenosylhomocysteine nucleosidase n=1 Tax=Bacillus fonticola TaxID=2728853 RepID=UPI0014763466|nr:5'-methylthioadenosine/S-adenosylhomocysteine nucleosidase [Bacillus fonticola]